VLCLTVAMLDPPACERVAASVRLELTQGRQLDDVLGQLRQQGHDKFDTIRVLMGATGMSHAEAKLLVHNSPAWDDRREADEELDDHLWRAAFIMSVVSGGHVDAPPAWAAECRERQDRATDQMRRIASHLPDHDLDHYRQHAADNQLGRAFAALVNAARRHHLPDQRWHELADMAEALCLTEILGEGAPNADDDDYLHAAHLVRRRTTASD
jgi:hypothetical protein